MFARLILLLVACAGNVAAFQAPVSALQASTVRVSSPVVLAAKV